MPTECNADVFDFAPVEGRKVVAGFDGGALTSDAGALLLGATDRAINVVGRLAGCFNDARKAELIEREVATLVGQRVFAMALGYEDLNDHDDLRHDPVMAILAGKLSAGRPDCAPVAGKSTLNRLELSQPKPSRYHKISHDGAAIEALFVDLFLEAHGKRAPKEIILDLDATDDPIHGDQEGRSFHGYYGNYCYLPLYIFCGRHLLAAKLRRSNIDAAAGAVEEVERITAQIRARWPRTRILLRADSGFCREALMAWCEQNRVDYVFGLAKNDRLIAEIHNELAWAEEDANKIPTARTTPSLSMISRTWSGLGPLGMVRNVVRRVKPVSGSSVSSSSNAASCSGPRPVSRASWTRLRAVARPVMPARSIVAGVGSMIAFSRSAATTAPAIAAPLSVDQAAEAAASIIMLRSVRAGGRSPRAAPISRAWSVMVCSRAA
jgi:hypothetical protein